MPGGWAIAHSIVDAAVDLVAELTGSAGSDMSANATLISEVVQFLDEHPQFQAAVTKNIGANSSMALDPRAVAAMEKELAKVLKLGTWGWNTTEEMQDVKRRDETARFVRGHRLLSIKHYETDNWTFKGRFVALGDQLRNVFGDLVTEEDLYTSPVGLPTMRVIVAHGLTVPDGITVQFGIDNAHLKSELKGDPVYVSVPAKSRPSLINRKYKNPAQRLRKSMYGLKRAGYDYEAFARGKLTEAGWVRITDADGSL